MAASKQIISWILIVIGIIWILQGVNILPGSFMTGQIQWAAAGLVSLGLGAWMLRRSKTP
ncbi:MAG: hypothetical protein OEY93_05800 [Anaerolineae bacterium]|nr:hypothetical protein [Anaerolineae bacterium]